MCKQPSSLESHIIVVPEALLGRQFWTKIFVKQLNIQPCAYSASEQYLQVEIVCLEFKRMEMDFCSDWIH